MAYLVELDRRCARACGKRAVVEVHNRVNAVVGSFCRSCGKAKVRELQRQEDEHPVPS